MNFFTELFKLLQNNCSLHRRDGDFHRVISYACKSVIADSQFSVDKSYSGVLFGQFGEIEFPFYSMGSINSLDLFDLDELILFSFYLTKKDAYTKVADLGANIGLHSILMDRNGWQVSAFEPDPNHVAKIRQHARLNGCKNIAVVEAAISDTQETQTFTRVIGNRTGSHLKGRKKRVYGEVEEFEVKCIPLRTIMTQFDFIKMDIEGTEADAICSTDQADWMHLDMMLEVADKSNAERLWQHIKLIGLKAYSQKNGWTAVDCVTGLPTSYKEGSLYLTMKDNAPFER